MTSPIRRTPWSQVDGGLKVSIWPEVSRRLAGYLAARPGRACGRLVYLPYRSAGMIVLDISDVSRPRPVSELPFSPPFRYEFGVHSVVLHPEKHLAYLNSEGVKMPEGTAPPWLDGADHVSVVGIKDPTSPSMISLFPSPMAPPGRTSGTSGNSAGVEWPAQPELSRRADRHAPSLQSIALCSE